MEKHLLSKYNSLVLRGLAILLIVFHNFLHHGRFGFAQENENFFLKSRVDVFLSNLQNSDVLANFVSFLGWIGVPIFVFLTGYGLAIKGFPTERSGWRKGIIKHSFLKLFVLLLPALLFFFALDIYHHDFWPQLLKRATYLTLLSNIAYPFVSCNPGVYWYFGLTFQLYLLWAFFGKCLNNKRLVIFSLLFLTAFALLCVFGPPNFRSIYRHCFTGWFYIFAIGVYIANNNCYLLEKIERATTWIALLSSILCIPLIILMSKWFITWLFIPVLALIWFLSMEAIFIRTRILACILRWIGKLSACIFVCHPIARSITLGVSSWFHNQLSFILLFYFSLTLFLSILYYIYYKWILSKLNS